jgi:hypothetical protein
MKKFDKRGVGRGRSRKIGVIIIHSDMDSNLLLEKIQSLAI